MFKISKLSRERPREAANERANATPIRHALVQRIRRELAEGEYLTDAKLQTAIDRMVDSLHEGRKQVPRRRVGT